MEGPEPVVVAYPSSQVPDVATQIGITFQPGWTCLCGEHATVSVEARTWAHINKHGGIGRIVKYNGDLTYAVRYLLGGHEKSVDICYISCNTEAGSKRESKTREFYNPRIEVESQRPTRQQRGDGPSAEDSRKKGLAATGMHEEGKPVQKKSKVVAKMASEVVKKAAKPMSKLPVTESTTDENRQPNIQSIRAPSKQGPAAPMNKTSSSSSKPVAISSFVPAPPPSAIVQPEEEEEKEEPVPEEDVPKLIIADERRKKFNRLASEAAGLRDCLTLDELRQTCSDFSAEEVDQLLATLEKEGRIFMDGERVYWC